MAVPREDELDIPDEYEELAVSIKNVPIPIIISQLKFIQIHCSSNAPSADSRIEAANKALTLLVKIVDWFAKYPNMVEGTLFELYNNLKYAKREAELNVDDARLSLILSFKDEYKMVHDELKHIWSTDRPSVSFANHLELSIRSAVITVQKLQYKTKENVTLRPSARTVYRCGFCYKSIHQDFDLRGHPTDPIVLKLLQCQHILCTPCYNTTYSTWLMQCPICMKIAVLNQAELSMERERERPGPVTELYIPFAPEVKRSHTPSTISRSPSLNQQPMQHRTISSPDPENLKPTSSPDPIGNTQGADPPPVQLEVNKNSPNKEPSPEVRGPSNTAGMQIKESDEEVHSDEEKHDETEKPKPTFKQIANKEYSSAPSHVSNTENYTSSDNIGASSGFVNISNTTSQKRRARRRRNTGSDNDIIKKQGSNKKKSWSKIDPFHK